MQKQKSHSHVRVKIGELSRAHQLSRSTRPDWRLVAPDGPFCQVTLRSMHAHNIMSFCCRHRNSPLDPHTHMGRHICAMLKGVSIRCERHISIGFSSSDAYTFGRVPAYSNFDYYTRVCCSFRVLCLFKGWLLSIKGMSKIQMGKPAALIVDLYIHTSGWKNPSHITRRHSGVPPS